MVFLSPIFVLIHIARLYIPFLVSAGMAMWITLAKEMEIQGCMSCTKINFKCHDIF